MRAQFYAISSLFLFLFHGVAKGCREISMQSEILGDLFFELAPTDLREGPNSHRPVYVSESEDGSESLYLYHMTADTDIPGRGRWVINQELGQKESALSYIDSWAVAPHLIQAVNDVDKVGWYFDSDGDGEWEVDDSLTMFCSDDTDRTVFFDSPHIQQYLSGFYVQVLGPMDESYTGPLFVKVNEFEDEEPIYMFKFESRWLIGRDYKVDACMAFLDDPTEFIEDVESPDWHFIHDDPNSEDKFIIEFARILHAKSLDVDGDNVYEALRRARSIPSIPENQTYTSLRNNLPIPTIGLGTGGLYPGEETYSTISASLKMGYRMFDLAREYGNEVTLAHVFNDTLSDSDYALRDEVFIISKVWPTDLGFIPTTDALYASLTELNTNYIDMYLLHWPTCDPTVSWMHCETTVDPLGTWQESWHALEKAYAEGKLNSIGVSNFDISLLYELNDFATIRPHLIQNHGEPGKVDKDVRRWCLENFVIYQPYAALRNLATSSVKAALTKLALEKKVSEYDIALKFFIQTDAVVIPRSKTEERLKSNLAVLSKLADFTPGEMASLGWTTDLFSSS